MVWAVNSGGFSESIILSVICVPKVGNEQCRARIFEQFDGEECTKRADAKKKKYTAVRKEYSVVESSIVYSRQ